MSRNPGQYLVLSASLWADHSDICGCEALAGLDVRQFLTSAEPHSQARWKSVWTFLGRGWLPQIFAVFAGRAVSIQA
jgi:hypothetical protein